MVKSEQSRDRGNRGTLLVPGRDDGLLGVRRDKNFDDRAFAPTPGHENERGIVFAGTRLGQRVGTPNAAGPLRLSMT